MANSEHALVNIIEVCKVVPQQAGNSLASPNYLPLTFFDILWLRFPPVQRLYFYQTPSSNNTKSIIQNLKSSLSLTLRHYLPLAGHLTWPPHSPVPIVEYSQDDAVSLTVAESNADFHHLTSNGFRKANEYHSLVPQLCISHARAAVLALQITFFPNAGFSIGVTSHHAVLDGNSSTLFLKSWARTCTNHLEPTEPMIPFYDRSIIKDPTGLTKIYADAWLNLNGPNNRSLSLVPLPKTPPGLIWCTLELTRLDLQKLKQWVVKKQPGLRVSSFVLTTAYLSICTAKMKDATTEGKVAIIFAMDARTRLEPPVPFNYFGNCVVGHPKFVGRCELSSEDGMVAAVATISEVIKGVEEEGVLKGVENLCVVVKEAISDHEESAETTPLVSISGSPRFEVYSTDFGWGKPMKVEIVSIEFTRAFSLAETRNGDGGIEIGFVKERNEVESFVTLFSEGISSLLK